MKTHTPFFPVTKLNNLLPASAELGLFRYGWKAEGLRFSLARLCESRVASPASSLAPALACLDLLRESAPGLVSCAWVAAGTVLFISFKSCLSNPYSIDSRKPRRSHFWKHNTEYKFTVPVVIKVTISGYSMMLSSSFFGVTILINAKWSSVHTSVYSLANLQDPLPFPFCCI